MEEKEDFMEFVKFMKDGRIAEEITKLIEREKELIEHFKNAKDEDSLNITLYNIAILASTVDRLKELESIKTDREDPQEQ